MDPGARTGAFLPPTLELLVVEGEDHWGRRVWGGRGEQGGREGREGEGEGGKGEEGREGRERRKRGQREKEGEGEEYIQHKINENGRRYILPFRSAFGSHIFLRPGNTQEYSS